ncbi:MAG: ABC transporter permease [Candidatus Entotheonella factor]|uniref:ABC transporter permease n=1 Tax=Entotheonella factor TaxID=1429438 RepID=W4LBK9_ENTF1|nr:MAG: ABC transporter permease [Candidatus Entotheonella factor]
MRGEAQSERQATIPLRPPPGPGWLSRWLNALFGTWTDRVITLACLAAIVLVLPGVASWVFFDAVWSVADAKSCTPERGACWAVVEARFRLICFGLYPYDEHWRSTLACVVIVLVTVVSCLPVAWTLRRLSLLWGLGFATFYVLMRGGVFGLTAVTPDRWGGLALTLFIFASVVLIGFPLAIVLALSRQSKLPVISRLSAFAIDMTRSFPLLTILFAAAVILPFALPNWLQGDKLYRVIFAFAFFFACYQAEIIRGGMQAIPAGQDEAAKALGLSYLQRVAFVLLPQAFRNALPATINQVVITFKETSVVVIIGFFEVMTSGNAAFGSGEWTHAYVEVYVFVALIYFVFVFTLSRYGAYLERRMRVGLN